MPLPHVRARHCRHAAGGPGVTGLTSGTVRAVHGLNSGSGGIGVHGECHGGTGVRASGQTALSVQGPAVFSRSGTLTIAAGKKSATKGGVALTAASIILATAQKDVPGAAIPLRCPQCRESFLHHPPECRAQRAAHHRLVHRQLTHQVGCGAHPRGRDWEAQNRE